jgi:hypothetical protein
MSSNTEIRPFRIDVPQPDHLLSTLVQDLGDHGFAGDFRLMLSANRGYLEAGIITGPLFGSLGAWWHQSRMLHASIVAAALLMAEPLVLILLSAFGPDHVFPSSGALPALIRLLPGWGLSPDSGTIRIAVYTGEFILGLGVVLLAVVRSPRSPAARAVPETTSSAATNALVAGFFGRWQPRAGCRLRCPPREPSATASC